MHPKRPFRSSLGFTLIELMVVVAIIVVLAALIIPALQMAQARALSQNCMAKGKAIATSIRTYSAGWDGWSNPDPEHYVKEFGYKLRNEKGYFGEDAGTWTRDELTQSCSYARAVMDFRCPADPNPRITKHAIPTSHQVYSAFAGKNLMAFTSLASRTIAVRENKKPHPGEANVLDGVYVFADLHATIGYRGPPLAGLNVRYWNLKGNDWNSVILNNITKDPDYVDVWTWYLEEHYFWFLPEIGTDRWGEIPDTLTTHQHGHAGGAGRVNGALGDPDWIIMRMDGYITFPVSGEWKFYESADNYVWMWIDTNENGEVDSDETATDTDASSHNFLMGQTVEADKSYRFAFAYHESVLWNYYHIYWHPPADAGPDVGNIGGEVPATALSHIP